MYMGDFRIIWVEMLGSGWHSEWRLCPRQESGQCDQGDEAPLALASKWDNSGQSALPPVAAGGRNCMWKGSHSYSYKLTVMVSGRDTGAPEWVTPSWHHESRSGVTAGPGLAPGRGQWQLGEPQGALQQERGQVHEGWEVSRHRCKDVRLVDQF